jgi:MFS family permease
MTGAPRCGSSAVTARRGSGRMALTALACTGVLASLQSTVLLPLVPRLPQIYDVGPAAASWILTATMLSGALATPILSRLADMHGKRRMIEVALLAMVVGSGVLVVSDNYAVAVAGRALQGICASVLPVGMSLIKDVLPPERVGAGIALVSATLGIGSAVGLPLAGLLYDGLGFRSLFWLTGALAAALALACRWLLPEAPPRRGERFDWTGAVLLMLGLTGLLLVLSQGHVWGWGTVGTVLLGSGTVATLVGWAAWQLRVQHPLVDVRLLGSRPVLATNAASFIIALGMLANLILASLQFGAPARLEAGLGLSVAATGMAMAAPAAVFLVLAPVVGFLLARLGGRAVLLLGACTMAVAYAVRTALDGSVLEVVAGSLVVGVGSALSLAAMPMIILSLAPARHAATANGMNSLCRMVGTATSTAALATLMTATAVVWQGEEYPSTTTIHVACWVLAAAAVAAAGLVLLVPDDRPRRNFMAEGAGGRDGLVLREHVM